MVDQILGIHAKLVVEQVFVERCDAHEIIGAVLFETRRHAGTDAPDVGDGAVRPDLLAKGLVVKYPDTAGHVFGGDVERHFCLE